MAKRPTPPPPAPPAPEQAAIPFGTVFEAVTDFEHEESGSQYVTGLTYTIRPGNHRLAGLAATWLSEGKIKLLEGKASQAGHGQATGVGTVT